MRCMRRSGRRGWALGVSLLAGGFCVEESLEVAVARGRSVVCGAVAPSQHGPTQLGTGIPAPWRAIYTARIARVQCCTGQTAE